MKAIPFPEANANMGGDLTGYLALPSYVNLKKKIIVNCFALDNNDIISITRHQRIWIHHISERAMVQPFGLVAVDDYFASVDHFDGKYVVMNEDDQDNQVEKAVNEAGIITPRQSLKLYFHDKHGVTLYDYELDDVINLVKKVI